MVQSSTIRALQAYLQAAAVEQDTARIACVILGNNVQACWRTFRQFQWKVVLQASAFPKPAVDVAFRDLARLLDQNARIQKLRSRQKEQSEHGSMQ